MRALFRACDALYRALFRLRAVGPMLLVGRARYRGAARDFPDGSRLETGDTVGTLHFDNARIAGAGSGFRRLLRASLEELARLAAQDPVLRQVGVYRGVTWLRPHGRRYGFVAEPLPGGPARRLLQAHFRLLLRAFLPREAGSAIQPHVFWLTRRQLERHFGGEVRP
jgi:hypothetical protein